MAFTDWKLEDTDPEDVGDILVKLERSFGIEYRKDSFKDVKNFGDICDEIESHIQLPHEESCTSQQAFYKVRNAIGRTLQIDERTILPSSRMDELFPRQNRRGLIYKFKSDLNIKGDLLYMKDWLSTFVLIGFLISLIAFFFSWKLAVSGLVFFYFFTRIVSRFSKEMKSQTMREFTQKIARENYAMARRNTQTVNRREIFAIIQNTFSEDLYLDKNLLTRDATFRW